MSRFAMKAMSSGAACPDNNDEISFNRDMNDDDDCAGCNDGNDGDDCVVDDGDGGNDEVRGGNEGGDDGIDDDDNDDEFDDVDDNVDDNDDSQSNHSISIFATPAR